MHIFIPGHMFYEYHFRNWFSYQRVILSSVVHSIFLQSVLHCVKSVRIRSFMVCIQSKCGEIPTRKTPNTGTLHAWLMAFLISLCLLQFIWWLSIIVITAIFTLLSHRLLVAIHDNNFRTTLYQALRWSCCATRLALKLLCWLWDVKGGQVYLFRYCRPFSYQCCSCVEPRQLNCVANCVTGFCVGLILAWKGWSICPYYLFFSRAVLERNQVLAYVKT